MDNPIFGLISRSVFPSLSHPAYEPNNHSDEPNNGPVPLSWSLPAHGESKGSCGSLLRAEVCTEGHYINGVICRCHRPSCPKCYPWAVKRASDRAKDYLLGCLDLRDAEGLDSPLYHVEISEPPEVASSHVLTDRDAQKNRRTAQRHLLRFFDGGIMAFHPYRQNKKGSDESLTMDGSVKWREGPHYHALVIGKPDLTKVKEFHERTGWVLKVIGGLDGEVPRSRIGAVLTYVLSHAGVAFRPSGRMVKQLSYFGDISTRSIHKVDEMSVESVSECPHCGDPLYDVSDTVFFLRGYAKPIRRTDHLFVLSRESRDSVGFVTRGMGSDARWEFYRSHPERFVIVSDHPSSDSSGSMPNPCGGSLSALRRDLSEDPPEVHRPSRVGTVKRGGRRRRSSVINSIVGFCGSSV